MIRFLNKNSKLSLLLLLGTSACSHSNVGNEWDCPRQNGHGCINIAKADEIAVDKLEPVVELPKNSVDIAVDKWASAQEQELNGNSTQGSIRNKKLRKVWFAPYIDSSGNYHEASVVYYSGPEVK